MISLLSCKLPSNVMPNLYHFWCIWSGQVTTVKNLFLEFFHSFLFLKSILTGNNLFSFLFSISKSCVHMSYGRWTYHWKPLIFITYSSVDGHPYPYLEWQTLRMTSISYNISYLMYHDHYILWNQGYVDLINQVQMFRPKSTFYNLSDVILIERCQ